MHSGHGNTPFHPHSGLSKTTQHFQHFLRILVSRFSLTPYVSCSAPRVPSEFAIMNEAPRQPWFLRLLAFFTFCRVPKKDAIVETPRDISTSGLKLAETALKGIPITGAKVELSAVLNMIKDISIVSLMMYYQNPPHFFP